MGTHGPQRLLSCIFGSVADAPFGKVRSLRFAQAIVTCFQVNSFQRAINRGADYAKDHEENQQSEIQILF